MPQIRAHASTQDETLTQSCLSFHEGAIDRKAVALVQLLRIGIALIHIQNNRIHRAGAQVAHNRVEQCAGIAVPARPDNRIEVADRTHTRIPVDNVRATGSNQRAAAVLDAVEDAIRQFL